MSNLTIPQDPPLLPTGRFSTSWLRFFQTLKSQGGGSVTSVSVTPANGITGTVGSPTTTPAITLALGNITPTGVASTGPVTGTNLSGTSTGSNTGDETTATIKTKLGITTLSGSNTGDQTISITGDVTAAGSTAALAATVTKVNGVSFAGLATGILKNTTATGVPSIAVAGDFPTLNQSTTGNAATATALQTPRNINSVAFNGTADITVTAAAGTLTGPTLSASVTGSALTSLGTIASLVATSATISGGTIAGLSSFAIRNAGTGAFDMTEAHNGTLTAGRSLTWNLNDAARTVSLAGNLALAGSLTTSGAFASTFTMTNTTTVTFPVTGTLATLAGAEALSNKTITASSYAGTTVAATTSILSSGTGGVGYSTGAGGAVTQLTSKATGVTLSKTCGQITMNAASLAASTTVSFTLTNTLIAATDTVDVHRASGGTAAAYNVWVDSVAAGSCVICVRNISAGALLEAVVLNFSVCKAVNA